MAEYSDETALKLDMSLDELIGEENKAAHNSTHEPEGGFMGRKKHKLNNGSNPREKRDFNTPKDQSGLIKQPHHFPPYPHAASGLIHQNPNPLQVNIKPGLYPQHLGKAAPPPPPLANSLTKRLPPLDHYRSAHFSVPMKRSRATTTNQSFIRHNRLSINNQQATPILGLIPTPSLSQYNLAHRSEDPSFLSNTPQTPTQSSINTSINRPNLELETNGRKAQLPHSNGIMATPNQMPITRPPLVLGTSNYHYDNLHTYHKHPHQPQLSHQTSRPPPTHFSDINQTQINNNPHHNMPCFYHGNYNNQNYNYSYSYEKHQDRNLPNELNGSQSPYNTKRIETNVYKNKIMPPFNNIIHTHPKNEPQTQKPRYTSLAENEDRNRMTVNSNNNDNRLLPRAPTTAYPILPHKHTRPPLATTTTKLPVNNQQINNNIDYQNIHFHHYQETTATDNSSYISQTINKSKAPHTPPTKAKSIPTLYSSTRGRKPPPTPNSSRLQFENALTNNGPKHISDDKSTSPVSIIKKDLTGYNVIVTNVPHNLTAIDIQEAFRFLGDIIRTDIMLTSHGEHTGRVSVTYSTHSSAREAVRQFDGGDLNGNTIRVFLE